MARREVRKSGAAKAAGSGTTGTRETGTRETAATPSLFLPEDAPCATEAAVSDRPAGPGAAQDLPVAKLTPKPHYNGHRERLRARFLERGSDSLSDYELLELLLFAAIPRRDVKPLAKKLLAEFGTLWAVINAPVDRLRRSYGFSDTTIAALTVTGAVAQRALRSTVLDRPVLSNWQALVDYCYVSMGHLKTEQFRLLFLNRKNALIADEVQQVGTVDHTPVYPREVVKRALELGACAVILVHNHPSGDPTPSRDDIEMTRLIAHAADAVGVLLHDHLIIGQKGVVSFKSQGLL